MHLKSYTGIVQSYKCYDDKQRKKKSGAVGFCPGVQGTLNIPRSAYSWIIRRNLTRGPYPSLWGGPRAFQGRPQFPTPRSQPSVPGRIGGPSADTNDDLPGQVCCPLGSESSDCLLGFGVCASFFASAWVVMASPLMWVGAVGYLARSVSAPGVLRRTYSGFWR